MKEHILKVAKDLEKGIITEDKARSLLLDLFGIESLLWPLTVQRVNKMMQDISKETRVALQGDERGWKEWWLNNNKSYLNGNDH